MNILDTIIEKKKAEVEKRKQQTSLLELEKKAFFKRDVLPFKDFLADKSRSGIIAEFKRKSPSRGVINNSSTVTEVSAAYSKYGASSISILTDEFFFGGSLDDLVEATVNKVPLLRKDFIIDEYQVIESKAYGADVILLIAACLEKEQARQLAAFAKNTGLNVLLEIHNEDELEYIGDNVDAVGINNRDLKAFSVDINRSIALSKMIPAGVVKISESGIHDAATIRLLREHGFSGFLMGEKFMKEKEPGEAFKLFVSTLDFNFTE